MIEPIKPQEEAERVAALHDLCILDTSSEERFDRLTRIAQRLFGVSIALVSLVDHERQWFKSRQGLDAAQTPRNISFCGHAILADGPFVIEDAAADPRFADNPLVTGGPRIRFYAGMPLQAPNGYKVGTLCLIDQSPRKFSMQDAAALRDLAAVVTNELANKELSRAVHEAKENEARLRLITDTVPALIAYRDRTQRFCFHNKAYEELLNLSFGQIHGRTIAELVSPQAYGLVHDKAEEVLRGYPVRYERTYITQTGDRRIYDMQYFPRYGEGPEEGQVIGFFSLGADITELKRIDRMKTEFVSTVSHELRTPLTSIRGSLGLIAGGVAGELPDAVKSLVGIAKSNCERLIRLINDILDSEKIESGKMRLDLQVVDIAQLVQQAVSANDGYSGLHSVKVQFEAPDEPPQVRVDSDRVIQVLTNLLSNAVKFSPPEGVVQVKVLRVARTVRVEVVDSGPGIPEDFQDRIFQKFSQADSSDSRQKGGTGLGLNISKALIEKMGGKIGFSSEAGAGTTFFLELPEWQNPAAPPLQAVPTQAVLSRPRILVCDADADADVASLESGKPRILHVEDDPDIRSIVGAIVKDSADFEFSATLNDARARLREQRFDLVLLDLALGEDSGWKLFEDIDALDPRPPVIVFSASDADPQEGKQVEAVLVKSNTSNTELLNTIHRVLRSPGDAGPNRPQTRT